MIPSRTASSSIHPVPVRFRSFRLLLWAGLWAALSSPALAASPGQADRKGEEAFNRGRFEEALRFFEEAEQAAIEARQDPSFSRLNQALALERGGRTEDAVRKLTAALDTTDLETQARAQYALGTLLGQQADAAAGTDDPAAVKGYEQALRRLEASLRLASTNEDAKVNHELAQARLQAARKRMEEQKQSKEEQKPPPEPEEPKDPEPKPEASKPKPEPADPSSSPKPEPPPEAGKPEPKPEDSKPSEKPSEAGPEDEQEAADGEEKPGEEMTREEARMILDALRQEEDAQRRQLRVRRGEPQPVEKDW